MLVGHVDRIEASLISGWVADSTAPNSIEDVIIYINGRRVARIACATPRPDLAATGKYGEGRHGFEWSPETKIPTPLVDRITVRYARSGVIVPRGDVMLAAESGLRPILITAAGRSGTTLLMRRLSRFPQVCIAEAHPYEVRLLSYWSTVVATLTSPADHERSMHPDRLEGDGLKVGSNPFSHREFTGAFNQKVLAAEYFYEFVPYQLQDLSRTAIREYYQRLKDDGHKPEAIFFAEKNNNLDKRSRGFASKLFPNLKEIVLVRDPRDLLCSQVAYFKRDSDKIVRQIEFATAELLQLRYEDTGLIEFVRYEDLVLSARPTSERIAAYLGVDHEAVEDDAGEQASFGSHATSSSPSASIGRWASELPQDQRSWCNTNWREFLDVFHYR